MTHGTLSMQRTMADRIPLRLLGVYAHPDDETFCAGGTLAKYVVAGAEVMVVSMTQGEAGQIRDAHAATRRTLGKVRAEELRRACQELGVQHVRCLNYGDGKLQELDQNCLTSKVTELLRSFRPDVVLTFGDDGMYGHPDHIAVGAATDAAFQLAGNPEAFPEQMAAGLTPHTPARLYHSCLPPNRHLLIEHLVRWLATCRPRFHGTLDFAHGLLLMADETATLGYSRDHISVQWYPPGFSIIEQGEPADSLYMVLSGQADVVRETPDGSLNPLAVLGPGDFFGEEGLAYHRPRNAYVIAREGVTCLVFAPGTPTAFAGRGVEGQYAEQTVPVHPESLRATTCIDISAYVQQKLAAIAAHRTQCPITPTMFPESIVQELFAHEYFIRVVPRMEMETELVPASQLPVCQATMQRSHPGRRSHRHETPPLGSTGYTKNRSGWYALR
jgi:LmbE family N-acetylglucosaminyl deacetylase